ncbi:MAG: TraM recognition domain-containing protein [Gammaproteobacteria bacterium]
MIRGIEGKHEHAARNLARDTRPLGVRVAEAITKPYFIVSMTFAVCGCIWALPYLADLLLVIGLLYFWFVATRPLSLPFRMPKSAFVADPNNPHPVHGKPQLSDGISFFGNDRTTSEELWFDNSDLRTHVLIFGSTGAGKTEALVSIAFNSLVQNSGFIYIDGKGDNSLFAKVFSMVRSMGREDDLLLINFMTGARDVLGPQKTRLSNTMNPFSRGSSSMLANLVVSLMPGNQPGGGGDDMWKGRAINFVESLLKVLVAVRDAGHLLLDASTIRDYFQLEKLEQIVIDKQFPVTESHSVPLDSFPPQILEPLYSYIMNLPGYNKAKKFNQAGEVREQHGFITMQLTRVMGSLADTYGHIIRTNLAEVDLKDVVLNRRVMVVLLPALEKAPDELSNLGKIIIASLKAMMAAGLGDEVEGDYRDVILRKPTNSLSPFTCIMDEYGYYAVQGFAVVPAQARSLGFSAIFAGQDLPAFQKASKEEAASIGANCNIKICMKLEDPQETWEYFNKVAGESYVTSVSGFELDAGSVSMNYMGNKNASIDRRQRVDLLDLKDQMPGEAHIFFKSKIVRARMFYAAPKPVKKMRVNQFLKVALPLEPILVDIDKRLKAFQKIFESNKIELPQLSLNEDVSVVVNSLESIENQRLTPQEQGIAAFIALLEKEVGKQKGFNFAYEAPPPTDEMSAFNSIIVTPMVRQMIGEENVEFFSLPLIRRGSTIEDLKHIERLLGQPEHTAKRLAEGIAKDIELVTKFPPDGVNPKRETKLVEQELIDFIQNVTGQAPKALERQDLIEEEPENSELDQNLGSFNFDNIDLENFKLEDLNLNFDDLNELPDLPDLDDFEKMLNEVDEDEQEEIEEDEDEDDEDEEDEEGSSQGDKGSS